MSHWEGTVPKKSQNRARKYVYFFWLGGLRGGVLKGVWGKQEGGHQGGTPFPVTSS